MVQNTTNRTMYNVKLISFDTAAKLLALKICRAGIVYCELALQLLCCYVWFLFGFFR